MKLINQMMTIRISTEETIEMNSCVVLVYKLWKDLLYLILYFISAKITGFLGTTKINKKGEEVKQEYIVSHLQFNICLSNSYLKKEMKQNNENN